MSYAAQLAKFNPMARLRRVRGGIEHAPSKVQAAVTRLSSTPDGRVLLEWLYMQTHGKILPHDAPDSALRELMSHRSLFDRILKLIEEHDGGRSSGSNGATGG